MHERTPHERCVLQWHRRDCSPCHDFRCQSNGLGDPRSHEARSLSQPRICNDSNVLSWMTQSGLVLLATDGSSMDQDHESDQTHLRSTGLRVLQGLRPRRRLPRRPRNVGCTAPCRGHARPECNEDTALSSGMELVLSSTKTCSSQRTFFSRLSTRCRSSCSRA